MDGGLWGFVAQMARFFEQIALKFFQNAGYATRGDPPTPSGYGFETTLYHPPNELAARVMREMVDGWTVETMLDLWGPLYFLAVLWVLLCSVGIIYCAVRIRQIRYEERMALLRDQEVRVVAEHTPKLQLRWNRVLEESNSEDEHKWRVAILEADILLNELLDSLGLKGETMADKMKQVDIATFNTIDFAWEAHKIRNRVAHDGADYKLTSSEVRRVIRMYERVFKEFKFVV